jgi:hypothetical protein
LRPTLTSTPSSTPDLSVMRCGEIGDYIICVQKLTPTP